MKCAVWLLSVLVVAWPMGWAAAGDTTPLWQVGTCDNSYAEFGIAGRHELYRERFGGGGMYEVGKADPTKNWCYVQPGPRDESWAGEGEHPFEVVFNLGRLPNGPLVLKADLVDVSPNDPPTLRVRVNDHVESFELRAGQSDKSLVDPANGREQTITSYVAAGFLRQGRNVVNLTVTNGSWLLYDCLSLSPVDSTPELIEHLSLDPTYLFRDRPSGLKQIVYASMDLYWDQPEIRTVVTSERGWKAEQVFGKVPSGHRDLEVEIAPVNEEQKVQVQVLAGGKTYECGATVIPQRQWKIYMMPSAHLDYGYTHVQDKAMKVHRENVESAVDWCAKYPTFGWTLEGSMIAEDYMANGADPGRFLRLTQQGKLGVMGFFASELTGICSHEGLSHTIDYYDLLKHKYGIESRCATQNDVPSMVGTVPMILNGHGIKYLAHGTNWVRAGSGQVRYNKTPYYWESPDGSRVLVWRVVGIYAEGLEVSGFDPGMDNMPDVTRRISRLVQEHADHKDGYPYDAFLLHSAYMDNVHSTEQLPRVIDTWNGSYAYPKLIVARGWEFFDYMERNFGDRIPTLKGDDGVFWEDGAGSSARETAMCRQAEQRLVTAEKLSALCRADFQKSTSSEFARAWRETTLYNEHTWGAYCSVDAPDSEETRNQWTTKQSFAEGAARSANTLLTKAFDRLCAGIKAPKDSVVVFNPSSWARTERVSVAGRDGARLTFVADAVPGLGYKVFPLAKLTSGSTAAGSGDTLENRYYSVAFDKETGAVSSIYDKQLRRELVDTSNYKLNSYLYVAGGDRGSWNAPQDSVLTITGQAGASLRKETMPGRQTMVVTATAPNAKSYRSEVVLYEDCKRIDFVNRMDKEETRAVEGCYFAFPFALRKPTVRVEIPCGVIRPGIDQTKAACMNWYCAQDFVTISDGSAAIAWTPIDSPLITLQDIWRGKWHDRLDLESGMLFAYVMNNYWFTNYKAGQGGELTFRFAMTSAAKIDDISAKKFGEAVRTPLMAKVVAGSTKPAAEPSRALVSVDGSGVVVQAVRPATFSDGTIIRLREMAGKAVSVRVTPRGIAFRKAYLGNLSEDKLKPLQVRDGSIQVPCRAFGLATVILER